MRPFEPCLLLTFSLIIDIMQAQMLWLIVLYMQDPGGKDGQGLMSVCLPRLAAVQGW